MTDQGRQELIEVAREAIKRRYRNDWQEVGAALRTRSGQVVTGVNLDAYLGRMAVCAEGVALGRVITDLGEAGIETIVAVRHPKPTEKDRDHHGGLALRQLPRADLGLRSQRARDRAGRRGVTVTTIATCCRTNIARAEM